MGRFVLVLYGGFHSKIHCCKTCRLNHLFGNSDRLAPPLCKKKVISPLTYNTKGYPIPDFFIEISITE